MLLVWVNSLYGQYRTRTATLSPSGRSTVTTSSAETTASKKAAPKKAIPKAGASKTASSAASAGTTTSATAGINVPSQVEIVADVNMHDQPNVSASVIRVLRTGETLTLVGQSGSWYKVTDAAGEIGYVTQSTRYTKLIRAK